MDKNLLARLGIAAGFVITLALICLAATLPGHQNLLGDACVTFTLSFVALCAYVMHQPVLMAKLQVALAPVENDRDID